MTNFVECTEVFDRISLGMLRGTKGSVLDREHVASLVDGRVRELAAFARHGLGLPHFGVTGIDLSFVACGPSLLAQEFEIAGPAGSRRIGFVFSASMPVGANPGVSVRVFDSLESNGRQVAAESFSDLSIADNSIVFFPSDRHVQFRGVDAIGGDDSDRITFVGSIIGESLSRVGSRVAAGLVRSLQRRYIPHLTEAGFEVRPTPVAVQQFLESILEMRSNEKALDNLDGFELGQACGDAFDVSSSHHDLLRSLRKVHERFVGAPLVATRVEGLHIHSAGDSVAAHLGRIDTDVVTSVIQVAQDLDRPWPFVLERDGQSHEVHLGAGQMLLLEAGTVTRSRPQPLRGRHVVTLMAHFRPLDWPWSDKELIRRGRADGLVGDATPKPLHLES